MDDKTIETQEILALTADIVSSHVANNSVEMNDLPGLIQQVYTTLQGISASKNATPEERPEPAVPVRRSVQRDFIICLEDGKKLKMLKRHLKTRYNMTPEEYRERWNLPSDYPLVAPAYAEQRRDLAKKIGLGRGKRK